MKPDSTNSVEDWVRSELTDARDMLESVLADRLGIARVDAAASHLADVFSTGGKVLACGNGGSACDAMHFCEELTGRFRFHRQALGALACTDAGHLTCTANDYGYESVFSRWVEGLGRPGDVLVVLSTSGNSANVIRAVETATARGMTTLGFLGHGGGKLAGQCDFEWIVSAPDDGAGGKRTVFADRIQEIHMLLMHILIGSVERKLFGPSGAEHDADDRAQSSSTGPTR